MRLIIDIIPKRTLHTAIVFQELVKPMPIRIDPKLIPRNDSQLAGPTLGSMRV
jgi:hypothetical protein